MRACLIHVDRGGSVAARLPLRGALVVGRDRTADLVLNAPGVSRQHARISGGPLRRDIEDLGSANGTCLNGIPLKGTARLRNGDRIDLGGEVMLAYRSGRGLVALPVALLALVLAAAGWTLWEPGSRQDPVLDEAVVLATQAVRAFRANDAERARAHFRSVLSLLHRNGYLEGADRGQGPRVAFALLEPQLPIRADLDEIFRSAFEQPAPSQPVTDETGCRLDRVRPEDLETCLRERVDQVLVALQQDPRGVPDEFYRTVAEVLKAELGFIERSLARGRPLIPMLQAELADAHMPPVLHYVALIESGYRPDATSRAGAAGLWQFMPRTARQYDLEVTDQVDERRDPGKSTRAAARYLRDLTFEFGGDSLLLTLAGYNRGENAVRRALKRLDNPFSDRTLWALLRQDLLPEETARYVPRYMAAAVAGRAGLPREDTLVAAGF